MALGKTTDERRHYYNAKTMTSTRKPAYDINSGGLGEVVKVEFQKPTGLKEEIRELADRLRSPSGLSLLTSRDAVSPERDRLEELIIEAHERGWSGAEIGRALRCDTSSAASRVRYALAKRAEAVAA